MERLTFSHVSGENQQPETCPFTGSAAERDVVLSTNDAYLKEMRINPLAPAANMRRITPPHEKPAEGERFVSWFAPDNELADAVTLRKEIFLADQERILYVGKKKNRAKIRAASQQLLELQATYLVEHFPEQYGFEDDPEFGRLIINKTTGDTFCVHPTKDDWHPLAICGLLGQEDICVVEQQDDGRQVLVAGFLATPTNWNLSNFVNEDMDKIHHHVAGYDKPVDGSRVRLKDTIDRTLISLPEYPIRQTERNNIFTDNEPALAHDPATFIPQPRTINDPGSQIFMRSERETLTRLPSTDAYPLGNRFIIFTIKPHVFPLSEVANERHDELTAALQTNKVLQERKKLAKKALRYLQQS